MLQVEYLDEHGQPQIARATRVLVRDVETNVPVAAALHYTQGVVLTSCVGQDDFEALLKSTGMDRTQFQVDKIDTSRLPRIG